MHLALGQPFDAYAAPMDLAPHLLIRIDTKRPMELSDFVSLFVAVGNEYERFIASEHPEEKGEARFLVQEVRAGSIIAQLVPYLVTAGTILSGAAVVAKNATDIAKFVETYRGKIGTYFKRGGREPEISKGQLADYLKTVAAIAHDPDATLEMSAFDDGKVRATFEFNTAQAREAEGNILDHRDELEATTAADHSRVLLRFVRPSAEAGKPGRKGGERAVIDRISPSARPVLYASDLAEQRMRHELLVAEGNVFRLLFDVDVNVEQSASGKPLAYRITAMHAVLESDDDDPALL